ncbi:hypothetical protein HanRHA438_Chr09g0413111 [Helianthus annuus]|uniref:Uncharacterized protein n=1 Tax=Helianthus annuus TaxID=4232 RepID=A0A251TXI3_HELAN|nr:hypothetical protein HanHA300_Chr09g0329391 [Helianthus annuus]KAJ0543400.1 hypothetical protein HanHA89_Chr09g0350281 [Helianthus annuus]KAJ0708458.1 hypothetical protein HanLR1_Chr09g0329631 [Helianthus annuus]KAJ0889460.1 hypothetical protein HanRHA438_Chr09g0413111 [Helianthus annuus]
MLPSILFTKSFNPQIPFSDLIFLRLIPFIQERREVVLSNRFVLVVNTWVTVDKRCKPVNGVRMLNFLRARQPTSGNEVQELRGLSDILSGFAWGSEDSHECFMVHSFRSMIQSATFQNFVTGFEWNKCTPLKVNSFFLGDFVLTTFPLW